MDIVFNCPHCQVELEVEADAAGESIDCPECKRPIEIPASPSVPAQVVAPVAAPPAPPSPVVPSTVATPERKFAVPTSDKPVEPLIQKAKPSLKAQAKVDGKRLLRLKTLRHSDCKEVGKDRFDDIVSDFLNAVGEENIISITPINYSYVEMGTQKLVTDFGIAIVYKE